MIGARADTHTLTPGQTTAGRLRRDAVGAPGVARCRTLAQEGGEVMIRRLLPWIAARPRARPAATRPRRCAPIAYEWRLFEPDRRWRRPTRSSFAWPRVVAAAQDLGAGHARPARRTPTTAIQAWQAQFLYGEFRGPDGLRLERRRHHRGGGPGAGRRASAAEHGARVRGCHRRLGRSADASCSRRRSTSTSTCASPTDDARRRQPAST